MAKRFHYDFTFSEILRARLNGAKQKDLEGMFGLPRNNFYYYALRQRELNKIADLDEDVRKPLELYNAGLEMEEISNQTGFSVKSIRNVLNDLKMGREFSLDEYIRLSEEGKTNDWIAKYFNVSKPTLRKLKEEALARRGTSGLTIGSVIARLFHGGVSVELLAASFQVTDAEIRALIEKYTEAVPLEDKLVSELFVEEARNA